MQILYNQNKTNMKKILLTAALVAVFGFAATAQEQGDIRLGAGLVLGTQTALDDDGSEALGFGINIGGEYLVTDIISVAPSYSYFFESEIAGGAFSVRYSSLNLDGRYYFGDGMFYALAGLSFSSVTSTVEILGVSVEGSDTETGLNIGGGIMYPISDSVFLNGQVKYNTPIEQLAINVGVAFGI